MAEAPRLTREQLDAGLGEIRKSPCDGGVVEMIVRRPDVETREVLDECQLDSFEGLVGDNWRTRGSSQTSDGSSHPDMQLTLMNARAIQLIAQAKERWHLAGDQIFIDMDLSTANLPPGTQIKLGSAVIEISAQPHTGCKKFVARFGLDAMKFVNSDVGRELNLRGVNAKVIRSGVVCVGAIATKCERGIADSNGCRETCSNSDEDHRQKSSGRHTTNRRVGEGRLANRYPGGHS